MKYLLSFILLFSLIGCNNNENGVNIGDNELENVDEQVSNLVEDYYLNGIAKANLQDYIGAISDYTIAIELDPKDAETYFCRGDAKQKLQDYRGAISDYSKVIELDPKRAEAYVWRGIAKLNLGQKDGWCLDLSKAGELGYEDAYVAIRKFCN